jgi:hypothetical protein
MRTKLLSLVLGVGLVLGSLGTAFAQERPPPSPTRPTPGPWPPGATVQTDLPPDCRGVDPNRTADPVAVAAAQRDVRAYLRQTAATYSQAGFATQGLMIATKGTLHTGWYDQAMALACGRLNGGYKGMTWVRNVGWQ